MPLIKVQAFVENADELSDPGILNNEFWWTNKAIRTELIESFEEVDENKLYVTFMNAHTQDPVYIMYNFDELLQLMKSSEEKYLESTEENKS